MRKQLCSSCLRDRPAHEFKRHSSISKGRREQPRCWRCQIEREQRRLNQELEKYDRAWKAVQAEQERHSAAQQRFEQSRLAASGDK